MRGIRVVNARLGLVLSHLGGMLKALLPLFQLGLGGKLGDGRQWMSWIALEDVIGAFYHILLTDSLRGPVNLVSPNPVSQAVFAKTLARILSRPCFFSIPRFLLFGEKAKELLLSSSYAASDLLLKTGYVFLYSNLLDVLQKEVS